MRDEELNAIRARLTGWPEDDPLVLRADLVACLAEIDRLRELLEWTDEPTLKPLAARWQRISGVCSTHGFPFFVDTQEDAAFCGICEWKGNAAEVDRLRAELERVQRQIAYASKAIPARAALAEMQEEHATLRAEIERLRAEVDAGRGRPRDRR